jgi:hypothetical protein
MVFHEIGELSVSPFITPVDNWAVVCGGRALSCVCAYFSRCRDSRTGRWSRRGPGMAEGVTLISYEGGELSDLLFMAPIVRWVVVCGRRAFSWFCA